MKGNSKLSRLEALEEARLPGEYTIAELVRAARRDANGEGPDTTPEKRIPKGLAAALAAAYQVSERALQWAKRRAAGSQEPWNEHE